MDQTRWRIYLLALLAVGLVVRLHGTFVAKTGLSHDESVSYLCAAGTQGAYERGLPLQVDQPLTAGDLHAYYARPSSLQFGLVAKDLAQDDIHPPLYFWLLHIAHRLIGMDIRTGPLMNLATTLLILVLLIGLARRLLASWLHALASGVVWFLSPAVVPIDLEARHYQLLGVLALGMFMVGRKIWAGKAETKDLILFTGVNALGFLTHYYYGFLLVPGVLIMLVRHGVHRPTLIYLGSLVVSLLLFLTLFPAFLDFVPHYLAERDIVAGGSVDLVSRMKAMVAGTLNFLSWWVLAQVGLVAAGVFALAFTKNTWWPMLRSLQTRRWSAEAHLHVLWYVLFTAAFYLGGISPSQAVGAAYFSYLWPLLCLLAVHWSLVVLAPRWRNVAFTIYTVQLAVSCWQAARGSEYMVDLVPASWQYRMEHSALVVTNEGRRGYLPRMALHLPAELPLRVCSGKGLMTFDATEVDTVACWLIPPGPEGSPSPFIGRMIGAGYADEVLRSETHELHYFTRPR